jgi:hypothetical protein
MSTSKSHDVVLEQRADIKILMPVLKEMALRNESGVSINLIGPIYVNNSPNDNNFPAVEKLEKTEEVKALRAGDSTGIELPDKVIRKFDKTIYDDLPHPKLDAALRLVAQTAYGRTGDVRKVASELRCSQYTARTLLVKYGVITS